jgi:hypothetical protein
MQEELTLINYLFIDTAPSGTRLLPQAGLLAC